MNNDTDLLLAVRDILISLQAEITNTTHQATLGKVIRAIEEMVEAG